MLYATFMVAEGFLQAKPRGEEWVARRLERALLREGVVLEGLGGIRCDGEMFLPGCPPCDHWHYRAWGA